MNAGSEMRTSDGLGAEDEGRGRIYALMIVLEADSPDEAFDRASEAAGPEPCNAHFVSRPVEIDRDWAATREDR